MKPLQAEGTLAMVGNRAVGSRRLVLLKYSLASFASLAVKLSCSFASFAVKLLTFRYPSASTCFAARWPLRSAPATVPASVSSVASPAK
jgi:hypothetical protein